MNPSSAARDISRPSLGRYRLVRRIAVGGMAEIFLARATGIAGFEKPVVLKRVLPHLATQEEFVSMFLHEARIAARLDHPNIAQVYDIGQLGDSLFFTMEYVHGESLLRLIQAAKKRSETIPLDASLYIATRIAAALHYAHERRAPDGAPLEIVHRDISHSNVLVRHDGAVKILDFGIAKAATSEPTQAGSLKGKFAFMSPEQGRGEPLDRRSDVFSLGIVLFELTTGTRLFEADNDYALLREVGHRTKPIPRPSSRCAGYPPALEAILMRALARERGARYPTAEALLADLETFAVAKRIALTDRAAAKAMRALFGEVSEPQWTEGFGDGETAWRDWLSPTGESLPATPDRTGEHTSSATAMLGVRDASVTPAAAALAGLHSGAPSQTSAPRSPPTGRGEVASYEAFRVEHDRDSAGDANAPARSATSQWRSTLWRRGPAWLIPPLAVTAGLLAAALWARGGASAERPDERDAPAAAERVAPIDVESTAADEPTPAAEAAEEAAEAGQDDVVHLELAPDVIERDESGEARAEEARAREDRKRARARARARRAAAARRRRQARESQRPTEPASSRPARADQDIDSPLLPQ